MKIRSSAHYCDPDWIFQEEAPPLFVKMGRCGISGRKASQETCPDRKDRQKSRGMEMGVIFVPISSKKTQKEE